MIIFNFVFALRLVSGCKHVFLAAAVSKANKSAEPEPASLPVALLDVLLSETIPV